jgi:hypothetical protein
LTLKGCIWLSESDEKKKIEKDDPYKEFTVNLDWLLRLSMKIDSTPIIQERNLQ